MPTYVISGVSRGIGFEFLRQISSDSSNTVIGLVRDKPATEKKVAQELGERPNIHILVGNLDDYDSLKKAAADTAAITGGAIDYLIANAASLSTFGAYDPIGSLAEKDPKGVEEDMMALTRTNVVGNIHLFSLFMPLILKGTVKKVIVLTTGMADIDLLNNYDISVGILYGASKGALNVVTAGFNAQYKKDGVLFLGISPGFVDTGASDLSKLTPYQREGLLRMTASFQKYAPHMKGPITMEESVRAVTNVWENASLEKEDGGAFISHLGNKQWL